VSFFFSSRRRHTSFSRDWSSDVCSSDLLKPASASGTLKPRMDVVAVLAMVGLPLTGVLSVPEALAGFSDPSVVLIAALFVIGEEIGRASWRERVEICGRAGSRYRRLEVV